MPAKTQLRKPKRRILVRDVIRDIERKESKQKKSRKRRDKLFITLGILEEAKSGILKSNLMRKADLSFEQVNRYLDILVNPGTDLQMFLERGFTEGTKRRSRTYIAFNILEEAKESLLKTQIMYKANLSYAQLNDYLKYLLGAGFLRSWYDKEKKKTFFKTTPDGEKYIQAYKNLKHLLSARSGEGLVTRKTYGRNEEITTTEKGLEFLDYANTFKAFLTPGNTTGGGDYIAALYS